MKKIYYSVILSLAFSLFSCSDFLDRESLSELSNGNFWNTEADATKALVGCYDALQSEGSLGFCWPGGNTCSLRELEFATDKQLLLRLYGMLLMQVLHDAIMLLKKYRKCWRTVK